MRRSSVKMAPKRGIRLPNSASPISSRPNIAAVRQRAAGPNRPASIEKRTRKKPANTSATPPIHIGSLPPIRSSNRLLALTAGRLASLACASAAASRATGSGIGSSVGGAAMLSAGSERLARTVAGAGCALRSAAATKSSLRVKLSRLCCRFSIWERRSLIFFRLSKISTARTMNPQNSRNSTIISLH